MTKTAKIAIGALALLAAGLGIGLAVSLASGDGEGAAERDEYEGGAPAGFEHPSPEDLEAFRDCLADEGVAVPQPGEEPGRKNGPSEETQQAFEACQDLLPEGGFGPPPMGGGPPGMPPPGGN